MKKLLYTLLLLPLSLFAQEEDPCYSVNDFMSQTEGENPSIIKNFVGGWNMFGYPCSQSVDLSDAFNSIVEKVIIVKDNNGNVYMPEFGFNGIGFLEGGEGYQIKMTNTEYGFSFCEHITWPNLEGCTDCEALNFNRWANVDDGSCIPIVEGCMDEFASNYDSLVNVNTLCEYYNTYAIPDTAFLSYLQYHYPEVIVNDSLDIDLANTIEIESFYLYGDFENIDGIQYFTNLSDLYITSNDNLTSLPDLSGLTNLSNLTINNNDNLTSLLELSELTNLSNLTISSNDNLTSLPDLSGLTNLSYLYIFSNYNLTSLPDPSGLTNLSNLTIINNDNLTSLPELSGLTNLQHLHLEITNNNLLSSLSLQYNLEVDSFIISEVDSINIDFPISVSNGLSIINNDNLTSISDLSGLTNVSYLYIGYNDNLTSLPELSGHTNLSSLTIDNNDNLTSLPELSELTNLSILYIGHNDNLTSLPDLSELTNLSFLTIFDNDNLECVGGYPEQLTIQDEWPPVCEEEVTYQVGDYAEGGIVFYVDETGERLLITSIEDLTIQPLGWFDAIDSLNSFNLSNQYNDWFVPRKNELEQMYNSIGNESTYGELISFSNTSSYWSASQNDNLDHFVFRFYNGSSDWINKFNSCHLKPIRAVGNWTMGCMDETACNYSPDANMADGSCNYAEQHYDCDGNLIAEIDEPLCGYLPTNTDIWPFVDITIPDGYTVHSVYADFDRPGYPDESLDYSIAYCSNCDSFPAFIDNLSDFFIWEYETISYSLYNSELVISEVSEIELNGPGTIRVLAPLSNDGWNDFCINLQLYGCTDETACNYNSEANVDDGSCLFNGDECIVNINTDCSCCGLGVNWQNGQFVVDGSWCYGICPVTDPVCIWMLNPELIDTTIAEFPFNHQDSVEGVLLNCECKLPYSGCIDSLACNYNPDANMADGSCEYHELGYSCDGNITEYLVGMQVEGGIVFYVDESGQHGLVAALEDLTEGATGPNEWGFSGYEWGCYSEDVDVPDGTSIGTGYQNTLDIVNQECSTENGGITASQAALDYEINGYSDWYLPSRNELSEMYISIGQGSQNNVGLFQDWWYWSSSLEDEIEAWSINFNNGALSDNLINSPYLVRPIRSF